CAASGARSLRLGKPVVQRISRAADGADRVLRAGSVEQLAQAADVDVDGTLVDVDVAAPHAVEQLLAAEHTPGMLEKKLQQTIFGGAEVDGTAGARHAALLAVELDVAAGEQVGEPFGAGAAQKPLHPRQQFRDRKRLDDIIVGA